MHTFVKLCYFCYELKTVARILAFSKDYGSERMEQPPPPTFSAFPTTSRYNLKSLLLNGIGPIRFAPSLLKFCSCCEVNVAPKGLRTYCLSSCWVFKGASGSIRAEKKLMTECCESVKTHKHMGLGVLGPLNGIPRYFLLKIVNLNLMGYNFEGVE